MTTRPEHPHPRLGRTGSTPHRPTRLLKVSGPEDLLAFVPVAFGFIPDHSVVLVTLGEGDFQARINSPRNPREVEEVIELLLDPCRRHGVERVALILYDAPAVSEVLARVAAALRAAGIEVHELLCVHAGRWWQVTTSGVVAGPGHSYDLTSHPFSAEAVLDGRVTLSSREALAASLSALAVPRRAVLRALREAEPMHRREVLDFVAGHAQAAEPIEPELAARLLVTVSQPDLRDAVAMAMRRDDAPAQVELWRKVVRQAPDSVLPDAAALLAFAAWLSGNGALAWCALERCDDVDPTHRLALGVRGLLEGAVSPRHWEQWEQSGGPGAADPEFAA